MGRKRKIAGNEDTRLPTFNEKKWLLSERQGTKFTALCVGLGLLMAVVGGLLTWALRDATIPFVLGVLAFLLIRIILKLIHVDTTEFDKMRWAGGFFTYFLTFIAIWIILINPPVVDLIPPKITDKTLEEQELGSDIGIKVIVDDNQGIKAVQVVVTDPGGNQVGPFSMTKVVQNEYRYSVTATTTGIYNYSIEVRDKADFFVTGNYQFKVVPNQAPKVKWYHNPGANLTKSDSVSVEITDNTGVILAFYGMDQPSGFQTERDIPEMQLKLENPRNSKADIPLKNMLNGHHNVTVCAMDRVPHRTTCEVLEFNVL